MARSKLVVPQSIICPNCAREANFARKRKGWLRFACRSCVTKVDVPIKNLAAILKADAECRELLRITGNMPPADQ